MAAAGTPVKIELVKVPAGNYAERSAYMIMSGDIPDLIYFKEEMRGLPYRGYWKIYVHM